MRWIAHRGNVAGPVPEAENTLPYLESALAAGFDVECDVWLSDGSLRLGHDAGGQPVTLEWLSRAGVWCHAKTVDTLAHLLRGGAHCFFQAEDEVAMTSAGFLWTHSRCGVVTPLSVCTVLGDAVEIERVVGAAGVCSDHVEAWRACSEMVTHE